MIWTWGRCPRSVQPLFDQCIDLGAKLGPHISLHLAKETGSNELFQTSPIANGDQYIVFPRPGANDGDWCAMEGTWRSEKRSIKSVLEGTWRSEKRSIKSVLECGQFAHFDMSLKDSVCTNYSKDSRGNEAGCRNWRGQPLICLSELAVSRPRRGSLALVLLHAWAWLEKLFGGQRVLFSIARGRSAGKEGKKTFQAPKSFFWHISVWQPWSLWVVHLGRHVAGHTAPPGGDPRNRPPTGSRKKKPEGTQIGNLTLWKKLVGCRIFFSRPGHFPRLSW